MKEPDVALTDYLLALEALAFAVLIARTPTNSPLQEWFVILFAATAVAAFLGGTVHGFFVTTSGPASRGHNMLWRSVLVAIGLASTSAWAIGAHLLFSDRIARIVTIAASVEFAAYAVLVVFVTDAFFFAALNYLPSTLFLVVAFALRYRFDESSPVGLGLGGLVLTLVAAGMQRARIGFHPRYFSHNALFHLLQAMATLMIFRAAQFLIAH